MAHLAHYHEAHPLPFVITHWVNLVSMVILIFTGFYIHFPFFPGNMGVARGTHMFFAFVILINVIARVVLSFFLKSAQSGGSRKLDTEIRNWLPQKQNKHMLAEWIKYYLFLQKDHPLSAKYGVPQKISYAAIPLLLLFMGYTGFCLWEPTSQLGMFSAFTELVGGPVIMRIVHYFMMWVFICFTMLHAYLANIEGLAPSKLMFFWQEHGGLTYDPELGMITGEDDLGHKE
jgi:Ni/Fe-hydrogenase 1 B-type cytochrome subunit